MLFLVLMPSNGCDNESVVTGPGPVTAGPGPGVSASDSLRNLSARGGRLYVANCQVCHGDRQGKGATLGAAPHNESGHTWHHPDAQLKETIFNGKAFFGLLMPPFKDTLTDEEVDTILAYIKTWWTEDQREGQADISRRYQQAIDQQKESQ